MSTNKPTRELSITESISLIFDLYIKNYIAFFIPMLISILITGAISSIFSFDYLGIPQLPNNASLSQMETWLSVYAPRLVGYVLAVGIVSWIVVAVASGICVKITSDLFESNSTNLSSAFSYTLRKLPYLILTAIIVAIVVLIGMIFFIIPGIIFALMLYLVVPAIIIENKGVIASLSRSNQLVSHRLLKTFGFVIVVGIIIGILYIVAGLISAPFSMVNSILGYLVSSLITAFIAPILPISTAIYYYSMLARQQVPPAAPFNGSYTPTQLPPPPPPPPP